MLRNVRITLLVLIHLSLSVMFETGTCTYMYYIVQRFYDDSHHPKRYFCTGGFFVSSENMNVKGFLCLRWRKNFKYLLIVSSSKIDNRRYHFHYRKVYKGENPNCEIMLRGYSASLHVVNVACVMEFDLNTLRTNDRRFWPHKSFFCN